MPDAESFFDAYPNYNDFEGADVWELVDGWLNDVYGPDSPDGAQNSCATRVSYGLNGSGAPIGPGDATNLNDGDRYIISARELNKYLRATYGPPSQSLAGNGVRALQGSLGEGGGAIVSSTGHVGVVTGTYNDNYVRSFGGDVWVMPGGACQCP